MSETDPTPERSAKRLFFALWPDEALRQKLHVLGGQLLGSHRGRRIPPENLHLTLAFLGSADTERQACLERLAPTIRVLPFTLTLDQAEFWPRKGILWAGATAPPDLLALVQEINRGLRTCGLAPAPRPYQVHLTMARNVHGLRLDRERAIAPMVWKVSRYALVASQTLPDGVRYEILRNWELAV